MKTSFRRLSRAAAPLLAAILSVGCGGGGGGGSSRASGIDARFEGFGAVTAGGAGEQEVQVTSLDDSGPGSLREALSGGDRTINFDVAGTIDLSDELSVLGSNVTIDGGSAPSPGITLRGAGIDIDGPVHDVVIRNLRIRDVGRNGDDGIAIENGASRVLVHAVSVDDCGDGNVDVTGGASDVTIQYSILSNCGKNSLNSESERITYHHNVFFRSQFRNPQFTFSNEESRVSPDTMGDVRNNVIWEFGDEGGGTLVECGAKVNVIGNFYECGNCSAEREEGALILKAGGCSGNSNGELAFSAGNFSNDGARLDTGSAGAEWPAAAVQTDDACTGARETQAGAGARPLDGIDRSVLDALRIPEGPC